MSKAVNIGDLRFKVRFEKNNPIDTDSGGQTDNYTELVTTKGDLQSRSGSRTLDAGELIVNSSHTLICRFQSALASQLNDSVRVIVNNRFFTVDDYQLIDEKNYYYRFALKERK